MGDGTRVTDYIGMSSEIGKSKINNIEKAFAASREKDGMIVREEFYCKNVCLVAVVQAINRVPPPGSQPT
jgi:hypothetical protein